MTTFYKISGVVLFVLLLSLCGSPSGEPPRDEPSDKKEAIGLLADEGCAIGDPLYYHEAIVTPGGPTWIMFTCLTPKAGAGGRINAGN